MCELANVCCIYPCNECIIAYYPEENQHEPICSRDFKITYNVDLKNVDLSDVDLNDDYDPRIDDLPF